MQIIIDLFAYGKAMMALKNSQKTTTYAEFLEGILKIIFNVVLKNQASKSVHVNVGYRKASSMWVAKSNYCSYLPLWQNDISQQSK